MVYTNQNNSLWMGALESYMTESFVINAFKHLGEKPVSVRIMRNKYTGGTGGYCFVYFNSEDEAFKALNKLNGKIIPNSNPTVRFRLNKSSQVNSRIVIPTREYSICVADLSSEVDDYNLYKTFASRYQSIRTAKVCLDNNGFSKGYGFIRFANDEDASHCVTNMNGFKGLGSKPLLITKTIPRSQRNSQALNEYCSNQDYTDKWQSFSPWKVYYEDPTAALLQSIEQLTQQERALAAAASKEDELELIEHNSNMEIDGLNREIMEKDYNLWDALESSKWLPLVGTETPSYVQHH